MAKRKKNFKRIVSRTGRYTKKFVSGYHSTNQARIKALSRNLMKSQINKVKKNIRITRNKALEVNRRLENLSKWGHYDTWASRKLLNRIDNKKLNILNENGLIDISKIQNLTTTQRTNLMRSMDSFINSKTSTIQGINAIQRNKRKEIARRVDSEEFAKSLTNKELEDYYRIFSTDEFKSLVKDNDIDSDEIYIQMIEAIKYNRTQEDFLEELNKYIDNDVMNDENVLESLKSIHDKLIEFM